eukprot:10480411-Alexandrium_andersonii.AAC.1
MERSRVELKELQREQFRLRSGLCGIPTMPWAGMWHRVRARSAALCCTPRCFGVRCSGHSVSRSVQRGTLRGTG